MEGGCCRARRLWSCEMPKGKKCIPGRGEALPLSSLPSVLLTRRAREPREGRLVLGGARAACPQAGRDGSRPPRGPARPDPAGPRPPATPPQPSAGRGAAAEGPGEPGAPPSPPVPAAGRGDGPEHPDPLRVLPPASLLGCTCGARGLQGSLRGWHLLLQAGSCWHGCSRSKPEACPWRAGRMRPLFFFFLQSTGWLLFT